MTISEAIAVNVVLRAVGIRPSGEQPEPDTLHEIGAAAELLAGKAFKALYAGIEVENVKAWRAKREGKLR